MSIGGTKIYCPNCKEFSVCKAISPSVLGKPVARRWYETDFNDIAWFRRARKCLNCSYEFLTSEVEENFIDELVELRKRLAEKNKQIIRKLKKKNTWLKRDETIPKYIAEEFIRKSAWWLTHSSGYPVRAPSHARRIYKSHHGWAIDFGANTFLVGIAIERCKNALNDIFTESQNGKIPSLSEVANILMRHISGAVANSSGYEYTRYYPLTGSEMVFGAQAIDVKDGANYIIYESGVSALLLET